MVRDDPDNRILECAMTGRAHAAVAGDAALLELKTYHGIRILTLASCLGPA